MRCQIAVRRPEPIEQQSHAVSHRKNLRNHSTENDPCSPAARRTLFAASRKRSCAGMSWIRVSTDARYSSMDKVLGTPSALDRNRTGALTRGGHSGASMNQHEPLAAADGVQPQVKRHRRPFLFWLSAAIRPRNLIIVALADRLRCARRGAVAVGPVIRGRRSGVPSRNWRPGSFRSFASDEPRFTRRMSAGDQLTPPAFRTVAPRSSGRLSRSRGSPAPASEECRRILRPSSDGFVTIPVHPSGRSRGWSSSDHRIGAASRPPHHPTRALTDRAGPGAASGCGMRSGQKSHRAPFLPGIPRTVGRRGA